MPSSRARVVSSASHMVCDDVPTPLTFEPGQVLRLVDAKTGHSATLIDEDDSLLIFGGTAPGPNSTMAYEHTLLFSDVWLLDTAGLRWVRPRVEGEAPKGRAAHSAWRVPNKPRILVSAATNLVAPGPEIRRWAAESDRASCNA